MISNSLFLLMLSVRAEWLQGPCELCAHTEKGFSNMFVPQLGRVWVGGGAGSDMDFL